jgi:hypothetical protein
VNDRKSAREFYAVHFVGNYDDWKAAPLDMRRAMNVAVSANQLADWVFEDRKAQALHLVSAWKDLKAFREWLTKNRCSDFRLVWGCLRRPQAHGPSYRRAQQARTTDCGRVPG